MTAILLFLIVCALLAFVGWLLHEQRIERERLINRLIAKTASEVRVLDNEPRERITLPTPRTKPEPDDEASFWADGFEPVGL